MTRPSFYDYSFGAGIAGVLVVLAITFPLTTTIVDGTGRKENNHPGPVPPGVAQITEKAYLLDKGVPPETVCHRHKRRAVSRTVPLPALRGDLVYTECGEGQTWEDHRDKSLNWIHSARAVALSPFFLVLVSGLIAIFVVPPIFYDIGDHRRKRLDAEAKRRELARSYALGDIDDLEYERAMDRLMGLVKLND